MMISKSYKVLWVCFILMFTSTQFIIAQDFYVSDSNGSDNNSGTLEAPFKTINKGISMVSAGGTVYVMDGIYQNENYGNVDPSTNTNMDNQHVVTKINLVLKALILLCVIILATFQRFNLTEEVE